MTARDIIHEAVKAAFMKDGWTITADPFTIESRGIKVHADLAGTKGGQFAVFEVKSFLDESSVFDFERALGQFLLYRVCLDNEEEGAALYLAVPSRLSDVFLELHVILQVIARFDVRIVTIDLVKKQVQKWIE